MTIVVYAQFGVQASFRFRTPHTGFDGVVMMCMQRVLMSFLHMTSRRLKQALEQVIYGGFMIYDSTHSG